MEDDPKPPRCDCAFIVAANMIRGTPPQFIHMQVGLLHCDGRSLVVRIHGGALHINEADRLLDPTQDAAEIARLATGSSPVDVDDLTTRQMLLILDAIRDRNIIDTRKAGLREAAEA